MSFYEFCWRSFCVGVYSSQTLLLHPWRLLFVCSYTTRGTKRGEKQSSRLGLPPAFMDCWTLLLITPFKVSSIRNYKTITSRSCPRNWEPESHKLL